MTDIQRRTRINELNEQIENLLSPNIFILNNSVLQIQKEIDQLQQDCNHHFVDGFCEICYKMEDTTNE